MKISFKAIRNGEKIIAFLLAFVLLVGAAPVGLAAEEAEVIEETPSVFEENAPSEDPETDEIASEGENNPADSLPPSAEMYGEGEVISDGDAVEKEEEPLLLLQDLYFDSKNQTYPLEPVFSPQTREYTVTIPDDVDSFNFKAHMPLNEAFYDDSTAVYIGYTDSSGKENYAYFSCKRGTNPTVSLSNAVPSDGENCLKSSSIIIKHGPLLYDMSKWPFTNLDPDNSQKEAFPVSYTVKIQRRATLKELVLSVENDTPVVLDKEFDKDITTYYAMNPISPESSIKVTAKSFANAEKAEILVNGEPYNAETGVTPDWDENEEFTLEIEVKGKNEDPEAVTVPSVYKIKFFNTDANIVTGLEVSKQPDKVDYKVGEEFNPAGMEVVAHYKEGETKTVDNSNLTFEPKGALTTKDKVITIWYTIAKIELPITVTIRLDGEGTEQSPYLLTSAADLEGLREAIKNGTSFDGKFFKLTDDITLDSWTESIGMIDQGASTSQPADSQFHPMSGTIDGAGHTIKYSNSGVPLFGYARHLAIHDLNIQGGYIKGNGLLANYVIDYGGGSGDTSAPWTLKLDRVTIKSGTRIQKSGITGGYASGANYVNITDCTVESGVKIGVNQDGKSSNQDKIGSFVGSATGTIQNSVSYADVYGKNGVGGIAGMRGQSMSVFRIYNCQFHGSVQGQENVGGILGSGYHAASAPNGSGADIRDCSVDGTVTGTTNVGGILGADILDQIWDNGTQYIIGNEFTGSVSGTNAVGGIIGYCRSLNRNCTIENNYFTGAASGIGRVVHIDTSAVPFGFRDGVFYFNTANYNTYSTEDWNQIWKVVDGDWEGTGRFLKHSISRPNQNRTDDPLGADIGKLFRNSAGPYTKSLEISGEFKRDYIMGEALDMTGAVFTVTWSDGRVENVPLESVKITGFDTNTPGKQTLTAAYGTTSATFTVTVTPKSSKITVTVSILGDSKHGEGGTVHTLSGGGLQTWVAARQHDADTAWTVWELLQKVFEENGITARTSNKLDTVYIEALTRNGVTLAEFDNGPNSGWMYTVNGHHSQNGVSQQYLHDKDNIVLHYSDDYTLEEGNPESADDAVKKVEDLIDAIGDNVTLDSKDKIEAARKAYNALTYAQKQQVSNYGKLQAAEARLRELQAEADKLAAKAVEDQIDALPSPAGEADREAVAAARKAYDALTDAQKKLVKNYQKLVEAQRDIALLDATPEDIEAADAVQKLIDALPEPVKTEDKAAVEAARKAYDALTDLQKLLVTNLTKLETAEERLSLLDALKPSLDIYAAAGEFIESLRDLTEEADLYALGMARSGHEVSGKFYEAVEEYVAEYIDESGRLHRSRSEDNSRTILVLTALGRDVTDVGGHNLLLGLSDMEYLKKQGVTGPAWALIALDSHDYEIPENPEAEEQASREKIVEYLMEEANEDGGWSISGKLSEAETTAVVLTALAGYYPEDEETPDEAAKKLKAVVDKGVQTLSDMQDEDGGYSALAKDGTTMEPNSESAAAVLTALSALNIDGHTDKRFVKNGKSVIDALCEYSVEGGGFSEKKDGERSEGATEVAYTALTAYLRMLEGETALYDMSDVEIEAPAAEAKPLTALTEPEPPEAAPEVPETTQPPEEEKPSLWDRIVGWFR